MYLERAKAYRSLFQYTGNERDGHVFRDGVSKKGRQSADFDSTDGCCKGTSEGVHRFRRTGCISVVYDRRRGQVEGVVEIDSCAKTGRSDNKKCNLRSRRELLSNPDSGGNMPE